LLDEAMKRRAYIAALTSGLLAVPFAARAQRAKVPRIGYVSSNRRTVNIVLSNREACGVQHLSAGRVPLRPRFIAAERGVEGQDMILPAAPRPRMG